MAKKKKPTQNLVTIDRRSKPDRRTVAQIEAKVREDLKNEKQKFAKAPKTKAEKAAAAKGEETPLPAESLERRVKVNRRRQIDPTTCEREYTFEEVEFMQALDLYKRQSGRMFPTCSEVLEVIRNLGYIKVPLGMTLVPLAQATNTEVVAAESTVTGEATLEQALLLGA